MAGFDPFFLKDLLAQLLLPPVGFVWLALLASLLARRGRFRSAATPRAARAARVAAGAAPAAASRWPGFWRAVATTSLLLALASSSLLVGAPLMNWIEAPYERLDEAPQRLPARRMADWARRPGEAPQAIVVLSGGSDVDGTASARPNRLSSDSVERSLQAARLARLTGLPVLASGGVLREAELPEAEQMKRLMERDLGVTVRWVEARSRDTAENAALSAAMLKAAGVDRILLVTQAYHMRRAVLAFEKTGLDVRPAPFAFQGMPFALALRQPLPGMLGIRTTRIASRELLGLLWYRSVAWLSSIGSR